MRARRGGRTWRVTTTDGATYDADVVVSAVGQLSQPVVPSLPGADSFAGPTFHSARWRHDVDLTGKRVAVVGTGASAIQFVPGIVDRVGSMTVFQRSAPYVVPKPDQAYRPYHHRAFERMPALLGAERRSVFWLSEQLNAALGWRLAPLAAVLAALRTAWRLHLRRQVKDAALRRRLVPDYEIGCKRVLFSNDWYPALDRAHVDVVTDAVSEVTPEGVRTADGRLHGADVLIWGTGFAATQFLTPMQVTGRDGRDLHEEWGDGAHAHLGLATPGFPNLFFVYGPNTNLGGSSIIGMMEAQAAWIAEVVRRLADDRARPRRGPRAARRGVRPRGAGAPGRLRLGRLRQLVRRRRPDHHQLAGTGRGIPATHRRGRLGRAGAHRLIGPSKHDGRRSQSAGGEDPRLSQEPWLVEFGGAEGTRTPDPLHAMQMRYQLRHSPVPSPSGTPIGNSRNTSQRASTSEIRGGFAGQATVRL